MISLSRLAWIEINLKAISSNFTLLAKRLFPHQKLLAVVKANAYGHGAVEVSRLLERRVGFFGVASLEEASELQAAGIQKPILIMGYTPPKYTKELVQHNLRQNIFSLSYAKSLSAHLKRGESLLAHIKLDTGMGRLGIDARRVCSELQKLLCLPQIRSEAIWTHLSCADEDRVFTQRQFTLFLQSLPASFKGMLHSANSGGLLFFQDKHFDLVRCGIMLYGYLPFPRDHAPSFAHTLPQLQPALSLKARVVSVKEVPAHTPISYGATYWTHRKSNIGVLPIGYADGVSRHLSNKGEVLIRGQRAPMIGRVCMDFLMIDLTDVKGACVGDECVLIGRQRNEQITADDWAELTRTISYEILTSFHRLPRCYRH